MWQIYERVKQKGEVYFAFYFAIPETQASRFDTLWIRDIGCYKGAWLEEYDPSRYSPFTIHDNLWQATHIVVGIRKSQPFKRIADYIIKVSSHDPDLEKMIAFIPVANIPALQLIDRAWVEGDLTFWATVNTDEIIDAVYAGDKVEGVL
ncbi:MAG: hypothetical protein NZ941_08415 [Candidatus Caldarchaeum sp.]|nr:hypothetical protein [Candidatus Caldarchaeum sp.]